MTGFGVNAAKTELDVTYTNTNANGADAAPFTIGIEEVNPVTHAVDQVLQEYDVTSTATATDPDPLSVGTHTAHIDAALTNLIDGDYLMARLDIYGQVNNTSSSTGAYLAANCGDFAVFQNSEGDVYVLGTNDTSAAAVTVSGDTGDSTAVDVSLSDYNGGSPMTFAGASSVAIAAPNGRPNDPENANDNVIDVKPGTPASVAVYDISGNGLDHVTGQVSNLPVIAIAATAPTATTDQAGTFVVGTDDGSAVPWDTTVNLLLTGSTSDFTLSADPDNDGDNDLAFNGNVVSVTIPAGQSTATISVKPVSGSSATNVSAKLAVKIGNDYSVGYNTDGTVFAATVAVVEPNATTTPTLMVNMVSLTADANGDGKVNSSDALLDALGPAQINVETAGPRTRLAFNAWCNIPAGGSETVVLSVPHTSGLEFWTAATGGSQLPVVHNGSNDTISQTFTSTGEYQGTVYCSYAFADTGDTSDNIQFYAQTGTTTNYMESGVQNAADASPPAATVKTEKVVWVDTGLEYVSRSAGSHGMVVLSNGWTAGFFTRDLSLSSLCCLLPFLGWTSGCVHYPDYFVDTADSVYHVYVDSTVFDPTLYSNAVTTFVDQENKDYGISSPNSRGYNYFTNNCFIWAQRTLRLQMGSRDLPFSYGADLSGCYTATASWWAKHRSPSAYIWAKGLWDFVPPIIA